MIQPDYVISHERRNPCNIKCCVKLGMTHVQTNGKITAADMNYKLSRRLIFKCQKRFREGRESLKNDSRRGRRPVNVRRHNLAGFLMDACINKGPAQHQEMEMMLNIFKQFFFTNINL